MSEEKITKRDREFWMRMRQALIIKLGAIEDFLNISRSIPPKHKREKENDPKKVTDKGGKAIKSG